MTRVLTVDCPVCDKSWSFTIENRIEECLEFCLDGYMICSSCLKDSLNSGDIKFNGAVKIDENKRIYNPNQLELF